MRLFDVELCLVNPVVVSGDSAFVTSCTAEGPEHFTRKALVLLPFHAMQYNLHKQERLMLRMIRTSGPSLNTSDPHVLAQYLFHRQIRTLQTEVKMSELNTVSPRTEYNCLKDKLSQCLHYGLIRC